MFHHYIFLSRCFTAIIIIIIIIHKTHQAIAGIKHFALLADMTPRILVLPFILNVTKSREKPPWILGTASLPWMESPCLEAFFRHFAGVLNFSWALLEARKDVGAPQRESLQKRCKKPSKASKSEIYIPTTKAFLKKISYCTQAGFLLFFAPIPGKLIGLRPFMTIPRF